MHDKSMVYAHQACARACQPLKFIDECPCVPEKENPAKKEEEEKRHMPLWVPI